jgi:hypothetical protein
VAILSLALLCAPVCSATCAICFRPLPTPATQSHDCEHAASNATGNAQSSRAASDSHQRCPAKPDCLAHRHSSFEAVQGGGLWQFQSRTISHAHATELTASAFSAQAVSDAASFLSDLAPPHHATIPSQQQISILRI